MTSPRALAIASVVVLGTHSVAAQDLSRYRAYTLESSVAAVVTISESRDSDVKSLHERPARIQQLEWRPPYALRGSEGADPVRDISFRFYNDALYQLVVTYDRERMEGLTDGDVIASVSAAYGVPSRRPAGALGVAAADMAEDTTVVARWEDQSAFLTLTRGGYRPQYQLTLTSKTLTALARAAIKEAKRLDAQEAPQRELDQRKKTAADARVASEKVRVTNKAAFRF
jgi:hypothetical protein